MFRKWQRYIMERIYHRITIKTNFEKYLHFLNTYDTINNVIKS